MRRGRGRGKGKQGSPLLSPEEGRKGKAPSPSLQKSDEGGKALPLPSPARKARTKAPARRSHPLSGGGLPPPLASEEGKWQDSPFLSCEEGKSKAILSPQKRNICNTNNNNNYYYYYYD